MLNRQIHLVTGATSDTVGVNWIAPGADWISHVYVNGSLAAEAFAPGTAERAIDVPLAAGALGVVEVHDFAPDDLPENPAEGSVNIVPKAYTRPIIHFSAVPGAAGYRLYHRLEDDAEALVWDADATAQEGEWWSLECPVDLVGQSVAPGRLGVWHFFRVEAVSAYGVESAAQAWAWRSLDVSAAPSVAVVSGTQPGTYTFIVTGG